MLPHGPFLDKLAAVRGHTLRGIIHGVGRKCFISGTLASTTQVMDYNPDQPRRYVVFTLKEPKDLGRMTDAEYKSYLWENIFSRNLSEEEKQGKFTTDMDSPSIGDAAPRRPGIGQLTKNAAAYTFGTIRTLLLLLER